MLIWQIFPLSVIDFTEPETTKTSHAEITLKSATLPRRKPPKMEVQVDIKPKVSVKPVDFLFSWLKPIFVHQVETRYTTELQHQVPDLRSAPIREHPPTTYTSFTLQNRSTSLDPQGKEHIVHVQKPPAYQRTSTTGSYRWRLVYV